MRVLMTGDEAVARGAYEAGVVYASAYPGTPSTEILENLAKYNEIYSEWAPNEKVAVEGAAGAAVAGGRAIASMKHVGLNVAADPLFTIAYSGINAGLVIVTADEPGQYSSQNEQDNRNYAKAARIPMLEPADSQECLEMTKAAFAISERFDTPVLLRMTTRVCHSKSIVVTGQRQELPVRSYERRPDKYVCTPAVSKKLRLHIEERTRDLLAFSESSQFNRAEYNDLKIGIIASGVSYYYGKGEREKHHKLLKYGIVAAMAFSVGTTAGCYLGAEGIVKVFLENDNPQLIAYTVRVFRVFILSFLLVGYNVVIGGYFTSIEKAGFAAAISLTRSLVALVGSLVILTAVFGGEGIWWSPLLAETVCLILALGMLNWYRKKQM